MTYMNERKKIKINILSEGRFHLLDLARELNSQGFDVKFYSFVPTKRAVAFGLPKQCSASITGVLAPFLAIERKLFKRKIWSRQLRIKAQDLIVGLFMRRCDVLISLTGSYVYAVKMAKKSGAIIIMERGSKHILEQKNILEAICTDGSNPVPNFNVMRELKGYEMADYISIASKHVKESFLKHNYPEKKLLINPYGTDLQMFQPIKTVDKIYDLIMVGGWSQRKGCDVLSEALKDSGLNFLHVGSIVDIKFPKYKNFTHHESVDQKLLIQYYNKAKVFILPSREEGLAMVQGQALACGLPLICSKDSGGEDLQKFLTDKKWIIVLDNISIDSIRESITKALSLWDDLPEDHDIIGNAKQDLSWEAYGKRYSVSLDQIVR